MTEATQQVARQSRRYYAALNELGFENTWNVLVFNSIKSRDEYVEQTDGELNRNDRRNDCRAIKLKEVTGYVDGSPDTFRGEKYLVVDYRELTINGCIGTDAEPYPSLY